MPLLSIGQIENKTLPLLGAIEEGGSIASEKSKNIKEG
jgi:hypothetical protein